MPDDRPITRDRVLDVAEALFARHGFSGTSMRDIAKEAGLTAPSLYNHFEGKDALYVAVLERGILPLVGLMRDFEAQAPGPDAIDATLGDVVDHLAARPHLARLIHHEVVAGGSHLAQLARQFARPLLQQGVAAMKRDAQWGFEDDELPFAIASWVHLTLGHFALAPLFAEAWDEDPLSPEMIERQKRYLRKLARRLTSPQRD